jgi:hypothetical protein
MINHWKKIAILVGLIIAAVVVFFVIQKSSNKTAQDSEQNTLETETPQDSFGEITASQATPGWNTYTAREQGFAFDYPSNWELNRDTSNSDYPTVSAASPQTKQAREEGGGLYSPDSPDFSVFYYDSIADEPENHQATTLNDFVKNNQLISVIGQATLGGQQATEVSWGGHGVYYVILAERNNHIYKLWFANVWEKSQLTETHKQIIASFRFIDDSTAQTKTFTDAKNRFSVEYPTNWYMNTSDGYPNSDWTGIYVDIEPVPVDSSVDVEFSMTMVDPIDRSRAPGECSVEYIKEGTKTIAGKTYDICKQVRSEAGVTQRPEHYVNLVQFEMKNVTYFVWWKQTSQYSAEVDKIIQSIKFN